MRDVASTGWPEDDSFRVLFVCRANVCRSPSAEVAFRRALDEARLPAAVAVSSAGTDAVPGTPWCAAIPGDRSARAARLVVQEELAVADLILAADRVVAAGVLRRIPAVRPRLFTMVEGAHLASLVVSAGDVEQVPSDPHLGGKVTSGGKDASDNGTKARLVDHVVAMDGLRGMLPAADTAHRRFRRRRESNGAGDFDLIDAHGLSRRAHRRTLRRVQDVIGELVDAWAAALANPDCDGPAEPGVTQSRPR